MIDTHENNIEKKTPYTKFEECNCVCGRWHCFTKKVLTAMKSNDMYESTKIYVYCFFGIFPRHNWKLKFEQKEK